MTSPTSPSATDSPAADYWAQSRQPLASLVFITPVLVFYEAGVLLLGPRAVRNGVDVWLRGLLDLMDFGQYFLLPVLAVAILLGWHYTTRQPWRVSRGVLSGMFVECMLLALCLRIILQVEILFWQASAGPVASFDLRAAIVADNSRTLAGMIGYLGAGVYEELLFRLILVSAARWSIGQLGAGPRAAAAASIALVSLVFSAAHYVGPSGEAVQLLNWTFWFGAVFRFLAGLFFSALFVWRGFGIAVGAHAGYDVLVKLI